MSSQRRGKNWELKAVQLLKSLGFHDAERTAQHCGRDGQIGDVVCPESLPNVHIEVKGGYSGIKLHSQQVSVWCEQAARDCPADSQWVVLWFRKRNPAYLIRCPWKLNGTVVCWEPDAVRTGLRLTQEMAEAKAGNFTRMGGTG